MENRYEDHTTPIHKHPPQTQTQQQLHNNNNKQQPPTQTQQQLHNNNKISNYHEIMRQSKWIRLAYPSIIPTYLRMYIK